MARRSLFILFLLSLLGAFFYFRVFFRSDSDEPSITDRMPSGDYIGEIMLLDVAREVSPFLFYNKIPFRDFMSYEFLLAQGKNYGVNLQKPVYFFANESGEWGAVLQLSDSSKVLSGIDRLRKDVELGDTVVGDLRVRKLIKEKLYIAYDKQWLFAYKGSQLTKRLFQVRYARKGNIKPIWKKLIYNTTYKGESLRICSASPKVKKYGLEHVLISQDCDSINMRLKVQLSSSIPLGIRLKERGMALAQKGSTNKAINLHVDVSEIRNNKKHPLYLYLADLGKRISFPVNEFFNAWEGDLSFQEGGLQVIKESYIETIMDEEFNTAEIERERDVLVPGYAVMLSMNVQQKNFINRLFGKGIMTKQGNRFRILASPPLRIMQTPKLLMLYSSDFAPKIVENDENNGHWIEKNTRYYFRLDSLDQRKLHFSVDFPVLNAIRRNKLF